MHPLWHFLTDFGDTAITVPLAIVIAGFLFGARQPRVALGWTAAIIGCAAGIGAMKIILFACGRPFAGAGLSSPSGHTAMSIAVYGGLGMLIGTTLHRPWRELVVGGAILLALGISVSRAVLGYHSIIEVVIGLGVGGAALAVIFAVVSRYRPQQLPIRWLVVALVLICLCFHGDRWPAERAIHRLAGWFDALRPWCG